MTFFCHHIWKCWAKSSFFKKYVHIWLWKHNLFVLCVSSVLRLFCKCFVKFEFRSKSVNVSFPLLRSTYKTPVFIYSMIQDKGARNIRQKKKRKRSTRIMYSWNIFPENTASASGRNNVSYKEIQIWRSNKFKFYM